MSRLTDETIGLAERIRDRRIELGMTQEDLALKLGYKGRSSVNKIEKGQNAINAELATKIAQVLDMKLSDLLGVQEITVADDIRNKIDMLSPQEQDMVLRMINGLLGERS